MFEKEDDAAWLLKGRQKRAVALALRKPMMNMDICRAAANQAPRIGRWDVSKLLAQFIARGIIYCINPELNVGKLFWCTDYGRDLIKSVFGISIGECPRNIDWNAYSFVVSSPMRKKVLLQMAELRSTKGLPQTAGSIGKYIRRNTPRSFNQILGRVYELRQRRLIVCVGFSDVGRLRMYSISKKGVAVAEELTRGLRTEHHGKT